MNNLVPSDIVNDIVHKLQKCKVHKCDGLLPLVLINSVKWLIFSAINTAAPARFAIHMFNAFIPAIFLNLIERLIVSILHIFDGLNKM